MDIMHGEGVGASVIIRTGRGNSQVVYRLESLEFRDDRSFSEAVMVNRL